MVTGQQPVDFAIIENTGSCKDQRIMDCFWTMWVLSFPNLSAIVPPNIQSTIPSSYFQACSIPFQQIFPKADVFKQNTRLGGESWKDLRLPCQARKRAAKWISLSHNFADTLTSKIPSHSGWQSLAEKNLQIHTLEAWGPAGAPARLPQFDWFVSRWLAVRPNRRPVKIPTTVVFHGLAATAPIPPRHTERLSASRNHFQLCSECGPLSVRRNCKQSSFRETRWRWDKWVPWSVVQLC